MYLVVYSLASSPNIEFITAITNALFTSRPLTVQLCSGNENSAQVVFVIGLQNVGSRRSKHIAFKLQHSLAYYTCC